MEPWHYHVETRMSAAAGNAAPKRIILQRKHVARLPLFLRESGDRKANSAQQSRSTKSPGPFIWTLPDSLRALSTTGDDEFPTLELFTPSGCADPTLQVPTLLARDGAYFYLRARFGSEVFGEPCPTEFYPWIQVGPLAARAILNQLSSRANAGSLFTVWGRLANTFCLEARSSNTGAVSPASATTPSTSLSEGSVTRYGFREVVRLTVSDTEVVATAVASQLRWAKHSVLVVAQKLLTDSALVDDDESVEILETCERLYRLGDAKAASDVFLKDLGNSVRTARSEFLRGRLTEATVGLTEITWQEAVRHAYHSSYLLGHNDGLNSELRIVSRMSAPLREANPEIFDAIVRGMRLTVLPQLRQLASTEPRFGAAVFAYALRNSGNDPEGERVARAALAIDPLQSDVYQSLWGFLTAQAKDGEALAGALQHWEEYPDDSTALQNVLDSALLLEQFDLAEAVHHSLQVLHRNAELALDQAFRYFEFLGHWDDAVRLFDEHVPMLRGPSPRTLCCYAECLVEVDRLDEAIVRFEQGLQVEPNSPELALGYARAKARMGHHEDAERFLELVLRDRSPNLPPDKLIFLVTMLAEIRRRDERPEVALSTFHDYLAMDLIEVVRLAGPLPALEYIDSLTALGQDQQALGVIEEVRIRFPHDTLVADYYRVLGGS